MTKANRIRELAAQGKADGEIAVIVSREHGACGRAYVRTCARQRVDGMASNGDINYVKRHYGRPANHSRTLRGKARLAYLSDAF